jgi:hypothetical protein
VKLFQFKEKASVKKSCENFRKTCGILRHENFGENLRKFSHNFFTDAFSLNWNNLTNIDATRTKHIPLCSQEQGRSIYHRNTLIENHSVLRYSRAKFKKWKKMHKNLQKFLTPLKICANFHLIKFPDADTYIIIKFIIFW